MNVKPNVLIVSVFQKGFDAETNKQNHLKVLSVLRGENIPAMELQGRYNGSDELSILIEGFNNRPLVERLAKEFKQECYLESHNDRETFLVYPDGTTQGIGVLTPVSKQEAEQVGSYSYNPVVDQYFVTR